MKECKSIEVTNTTEMQIRQDSKSWNPLGMSPSKDGCNYRNSIWKLFQLMKECESIEVTNMIEMHIRQTSKLWNQPQM
jgi:hypothetical protein